MWTSIATNLASVAVSHLLPKAPNQDLSRSTSNSSCCGHCKNPSSSSGEKQQNTKKQNNGNRHCKVILPDKGNYEVNIKKVESNNARVNFSSSNSTLKTQNKTFNKSSQPYLGKQMQQNGNENQNQQNVNKKQNGNQYNPNKQNGNQNIQNGNRNRQNGYQNGQNGNQNKQIGNQNRHNGNQNKQSNQNKPNGNQNKPNFNQNKTAVAPNRPMNAKPNGQMINKQEFVQHGKQVVFLNCSVNLGGKNADIQSVKQGLHVKESGSPRGQSTWMYLGRLKIGTTEPEIKNYLQIKFPGYNFMVEMLPLYRDAKLPCFKVKVDNRILKDFQNLEIWPAGVKITEFKPNFKS